MESFMCFPLICFKLRMKFFNSLCHWKKPYTDRQRTSTKAELYQCIRNETAKTSSDNDNDTSVMCLHAGRSRNVSQTSCLRLDEPDERRSRLPSLSHCPCPSRDCSTGESGYETIEGQSTPKTSDETVNELKGSMTNVRVSGISQWISRLSTLWRQVRRNVKVRDRSSNSTLWKLVDEKTNCTCKTYIDRIIAWSTETQLPKGHLKCDFNSSKINQSQSAANEDTVSSSSDNQPPNRRNKAHFKTLNRNSLGKEKHDLSIDSLDVHDRVSVSSFFTIELIDPVYSKIHSSWDGFIDANENSQWDQDIQLCEVCRRRQSWSKYNSQHTPTHQSDYIYYQPYRRPAAQPGLHPLNRAHSPSNVCSAWSVHPVTSLVEQEGARVRDKTEPDIPPQLPARLYGQSTVNLVNRLRRILNPKFSWQTSPSKRMNADVQRAATLTGLCSAPTPALNVEAHSRHSLTSAVSNRMPKHSLVDGSLLNGAARHIEVTMDSTVSGAADNRLHCNSTHRPAGDSSVPTGSQLPSTFKSPKHHEARDNSTQLISLTECPSLPTIPSRTANPSAMTPQQTESSKQTIVTVYRPQDSSGVQKMMSEDASKLSIGTELNDGLRHIDSEIDIWQATYPHFSVNSALSPMRHIYLPSRQNEVPGNQPKPTTALTSVQATQATHSINHARLRSPAHRGALLQSLITMSPLMERSLEEDETRRLLLAH